ncbi:hypothetical protein EXN66_Car017796 [Channa argus]|uniref:Uncharacterized protein n=1 Tax=Channa argus TaxID=215402 RepID=A0A6G1QIN0_CHAAH|nr:hypothetical protein EXN66_Car017796 [Channa argus]
MYMGEFVYSHVVVGHLLKLAKRQEVCLVIYKGKTVFGQHNRNTGKGWCPG